MAKLSTMIDEFLSKRRDESSAEREKLAEEYRKAGQFAFYPSSISKCEREIVYGMLGYPRADIPERILRIFDNGDSMHERYQGWFGEMGILILSELVLKDEELCIRGRTDALIRLDDELVLVELKSANDRSFSFMAKSNEPKEDYVEQLQLYLHLTGIRKGIILVENKNDQSVLEFWIEYDNELANRLVDKIKRTVAAAKDVYFNNADLPERQYAKSTFQCRYCDFNEICWNS